MPTHTALGIDIGGSFIKAAPVNCSTGQLLQEVVLLPTPCSSPEDLIVSLSTLVRQFDWRGPVGIGFPGVVRNGVISTAVHLNPAWIGVNLEQEMTARLKLKVHVLNDADAAGIAEMRFGAGKGDGAATDGVVLLVTLGTGIGSALFNRGALIPNTEFGHVYMADGREAESVASASLRTKFNLTWQEYGQGVNDYLTYVTKLVAPDLIIIGGGISENWTHFSGQVPAGLLVRPAVLGNTAGLIGAALSGCINSRED